MRLLLLALVLSLAACGDGGPGGASGAAPLGTFRASLVADGDTLSTAEGDLPAPVASYVTATLPRPASALSFRTTVWPLADSLERATFLVGYVEDDGASVAYTTDFLTPRFGQSDSVATEVWALTVGPLWPGDEAGHPLTVSGDGDSLAALAIPAPAASGFATVDASAFAGRSGTLVVRTTTDEAVSGLAAVWRLASGGWYGSHLDASAPGVFTGDVAGLVATYPEIVLIPLPR